MRLFFETSMQARVFIALLPVGLLLAACVDAASIARKTKPFWDIVILLACGLGLVVFLALLKDDGVRGYHLLAILTGILLYVCGIGRLWRCCRHHLQKISTAKRNKQN